jgi:pimeloyl-ACP methyl ester carboxylesterase
VTDATTSPRAIWKRRGWRAVRVLLFSYLGVCLVLSLLQTTMIFPGAATQGQRHAVVRPMPGTELLSLKTKQSETVAALFGPALTPEGRPHPEARSRPTVLFFYGNGMCMADAIGIFLELRRQGANVIVSDFLGFGMSGGKPSEQGCYDTADAVYAHAVGRADVDPKKIVPMGWSLGAATAIDLASREPVAGVATFSAFTSMADMARRVLPIFPSSLLLKHRFETERKIATLKCPIFLAHGRRDSIIPSFMSERLARVAGDRVVDTMFIDEADHNDFFEVGGLELSARIKAFLDRI